MSESKKRGGGNEFDLKVDTRLQAVVLADSFTKLKFRPITLEKPKVLLPVCNIPMIEYCLESLVSVGVLDIFVFAASHSSLITGYLESRASMWLLRAPHVTIKCIVSETAMSAGDALRHLDALNVIKNDFVLVSGDCVSTIDLKQVIKEHKERVRIDKSNSMTIVFKKTGGARCHRTRSLTDDLLVVLDPVSGRLISYENSISMMRSQTIDIATLQANKHIQIRNDLMDTHIDICTPEVLLLFTENFDYQDIRSDFVRGVLGSDVLGNKLFGYISESQYATRLLDLRTYDSVSRDVIHRWTYPMVLDSNFVADTNYAYERGAIYRESDVVQSRGSQLGVDVVIGASTKIAAGTSISNSVIGRDCVIGSNCQIKDSYIWGKVTIEDNVKIDRAIIADGSLIKKGAIIERGAVISFNVVIGEGFRVEPYRMLTTLSLSDSISENAIDLPRLSSSSSNPLHVGVGGVGRVYDPKTEDEDNDDELDHDDEHEHDDDDQDDDANQGDHDDSFNTSALSRRYHLNSTAPDMHGFIKACNNYFVQSDDEDDDQDDDGNDDDDDDNNANDNFDDEVHSNEDDGKDEDDEGEDDDEDASSSTVRSRTSTAQDSRSASSFSSSSSSSSSSSLMSRYFSEVSSTLLRGHRDDLDVDGIMLELTSLKLAHDASLIDYFNSLILAIFKLLPNDKTAQTTPSTTTATTKISPVLTKALGQILKKWHLALKKYAKQQVDQRTLLKCLESVCSGSESSVALSPSFLQSLFAPTLQFLCANFEVLSEDVVLEWSALPSTDVNTTLRGEAAEFIAWLKEEEEEEDEEADEDEN